MRSKSTSPSLYLREVGQAELLHELRDIWLRVRPEPGRPQIEPVIGYRTRLVGREDSSAQALAGLSEDEVQSFGVKAPGGTEAGKAAPDDGNRRPAHVYSKSSMCQPINPMMSQPRPAGNR